MQKSFRITALLLTLVLLLGFAACGGEQNGLTNSFDNSINESAQQSQDDSALESSQQSQDDSALESSQQSQDDVDSDNVAAEGECTPLLYKAIGKDGGVLYLFGTIHVGDDRMVFPDYVTTAFENSDFLCVEADIEAYQSDMAKMYALTKKMLCEKGKTIEDHLGTELYEDLKALLDEKGLYYSIYDSYRPMMWESLLQNALVTDCGLEASGADVKLLQMAKDTGKEIREAESVEFQYDMLLGFSDEIMRMLIGMEVKYYQIQVFATSYLYNLWLEGNENEFNAYLNSPDNGDMIMTEEEQALYDDYNKAMITDRNLAMADLAEDYLAEGKTGFFAVGAAHIVGQGALVELLRDRGYTVTLVNE